MPNYEVYDFQAITGKTHKEIGVAEIISSAVIARCNIVVISSGNYVGALRKQAEITSPRMRIYNLVNNQPSHPLDVRIPKGHVLKSSGERINLVRTMHPDIGELLDHTDTIPFAYRNHALALLDDHPDYVVCPIGSGKLWYSIVNAITSATKVIGVTVEGKNPFVNCSKFGERTIADKLVSPYTLLADAIKHLSSKGHIITEVSEEELEEAHKKSTDDGFLCEPSGSAGFVVFNKQFRDRAGISPKANVKIVSTGKGY